MNKKIMRILILLVITAVVLTGCAGGVRAESTPGLTVSADHVYIAYMTKVYQLDRLTGNLIGSYPAAPKNTLMMYAPPAVSDGGVFFGDLANEFHKVSEANLNELQWTFTGAKGWFQAKATVNDNLVIVPCNDRNIYALNTDSGEQVWYYEGDFAFIAEPLIIGDKVVVSSQDHHIVVLDLANGNELYRVETQGAVVSSPLYVESTNSVYVGSLGRELTSFDLETGKVNWTFGENRNLATIWGTPILLEDELIFVDKAGKIIALDPESSEQLWMIEAGGSVVAGLAKVEGEGFLVALENGNLQFYGLDHFPKWAATVSGQIYSAPIVEGDLIYIPAVKGDSILYTYNVTGQQGWSYNPAN